MPDLTRYERFNQRKAQVIGEAAANLSRKAQRWGNLLSVFMVLSGVFAIVYKLENDPIFLIIGIVCIALMAWSLANLLWNRHRMYKEASNVVGTHLSWSNFPPFTEERYAQWRARKGLAPLTTSRGSEATPNEVQGQDVDQG
ncbi:MAG: hypothetical protein JWO62_1357 [Acidimicrobiaceae bacterium]|nr:hypothetical protein [Acidimicrobiaceae bacterium]